jgi:hypothetical protein
VCLNCHHVCFFAVELFIIAANLIMSVDNGIQQHPSAEAEEGAPPRCQAKPRSGYASRSNCTGAAGFATAGCLPPVEYAAAHGSRLIDPHLQLRSAGRNQIALALMVPTSGIQTGRLKVQRNTACLRVLYDFPLPFIWLDQAKPTRPVVCLVCALGTVPRKSSAWPGLRCCRFLPIQVSMGWDHGSVWF